MNIPDSNFIPSKLCQDFVLQSRLCKGTTFDDEFWQWLDTREKASWPAIFYAASLSILYQHYPTLITSMQNFANLLRNATDIEKAQELRQRREANVGKPKLGQGVELWPGVDKALLDAQLYQTIYHKQLLESSLKLTHSPSIVDYTTVEGSLPNSTNDTGWNTFSSNLWDEILLAKHFFQLRKGSNSHGKRPMCDDLAFDTYAEASGYPRNKGSKEFAATVAMIIPPAHSSSSIQSTTTRSNGINDISSLYVSVTEGTASSKVTVITAMATMTNGQARYPCPLSKCDKDYSTRGHARRHSRIHSRERLFKCPHANCASTFNRRDNCHQHQRTVHTSHLTALRLSQDRDQESSFKTSIEKLIKPTLNGTSL